MDFSKDYIFNMQMTVRDYEVDVEGIVNNANYLHYMEHTRHEFCKKVGFSFRQMRESGLTPVATHIEIAYRRSLGLGEEMTSCINLERKGPVFVFYQDIYNADKQLVTTGVVKIACLENGKLTRGDQLAEYFKEYLK